MKEESSWNPWIENGQNAPWIASKQHWTQFKDEHGIPYWHNYRRQKSTYKRPKEYESADEIDHDSMDDD